MERRFVLFLVLAFGVLFGYVLADALALSRRRSRRRGRGRQKQPARPGPRRESGASKPPAGGRQKAAGQPRRPAAARIAGEKPGRKSRPPSAPPPPEAPEQWVTLGSADPDAQKNPYRMLVTLTTKGAALARLELQQSALSRHRRALRLSRPSVLGLPTAAATAVRSQVVGPGTPAAEAGLKPGDVSRPSTAESVFGPKSLEEALRTTRPGSKRPADGAPRRQGTSTLPRRSAAARWT